MSRKPGEDGRYIVSGTIEEKETGRPLANLIVRAFDKDLVFDDRLGFATTDADGRFEIRFTSDAFKEWAGSRLDLYLRVLDAGGTRVLHETTDAIRRRPSHDERYRIAISGTALDPRRRAQGRKR
jgi:hypothetical protein